MEEITLNDQVILYDRTATRAAYRSIEQGGADLCDCGGCKNFRQFRSQVYGPKLCAMLEQLGIDPAKEWEVYTAGVEVNEGIEYGGWFVFVGEWSPKNTVTSAGSLVSEEQFFCFTDNFTEATDRFGPKTLAVQFFIEVPKAADFSLESDEVPAQEVPSK